MKKLTNTVKRMLDALAYADAGEYMTLRDKTRILDKAPADVARAPVTAGPAAVAAGGFAFGARATNCVLIWNQGRIRPSRDVLKKSLDRS